MKLEVNGGKEELMKTEENTSHWDIVAYKKKKKEKEVKENIWRRKIYFWQRRRRIQREQKANNWRTKIYFRGEEEQRRRKEEEDIWRRKIPKR